MNQWDEKFLREAPTIPFGSIMNAYGRAYPNIKSEAEFNTFLERSKRIFQESQELIKKSFDDVAKKKQGLDNNNKLQFPQKDENAG